jgi:hypothetical protein
MAHDVSWLDRLRIERIVWALDQRLYDLPRRSRIAKRREVRQNLHTAAGDIGIREALANLGDARRLAAEYRLAEYGDAARPAWMTAAVFLLTSQLILTSFLTEAVTAFAAGIKAADAHATGTFTWSGIRYLQTSVTYTVRDGHASSVGGAWSPVAWAIWFSATVLVGRLWRLWPTDRRRRTASTDAP